MTEQNNAVVLSMSWTEAEALHDALAGQWHRRTIVAEFLEVLGSRLKERPADHVDD